MVQVSIHNDRVHFEVEGWDKFWALKSSLEIPAAHIRAVRADPEPARGWWHGFRLPGAQIPGILTAGSFYQSDGFVFYDTVTEEQRKQLSDATNALAEPLSKMTGAITL